MIWPGLVGAWHHGDAKGLLYSVLFSWAICWLLLATFIWAELVAKPVVVVGWGLLGLFLLVMLCRGFFQAPSYLAAGEDVDTLFQAAQQEYLKGNWFEAEAKLLQVLQVAPDDAPAGLLLVGVLRHTSRFGPALRRLEQLNLLDASRGWQFELAQEKRLIERAKAENSGSSNEENA